MTEITARVVANFPALVVGEGGVTVDKSGGVYTIGYDYDVFWSTKGDLLVRGDVNPQALPAGVLNYVLTSNGPGEVPEFKPVGAAQIPPGSITEPLYSDDSVSTRALAPGSVTNPILAGDAVGTDNIIDLNVTTTKINDLAVTDAKLADGSVSPVKIQTQTQGDIAYYGSGGQYKTLVAGTPGDVLQTNGPGADPAWITASGGAAALPRGYIDGLIMSMAGSPFFGVASGKCRSDADASDIVLSTSLTKDFSNSWSVGTGNGSLDTGVASNSTWYHVFAIKRSDTGVVDVLTSLSPSSPTLPLNYNSKRIIGSIFITSVGDIRPFVQFGEKFLWSVPIRDISTTVGTSAVLFAVSTPTGRVTEVLLSGISFVSPLGSILITNTSQTDSATSTATIFTCRNATTSDVGQFNSQFFTNTSNQIRIRAELASTIIDINTNGWNDSRGRNE